MSYGNYRSSTGDLHYYDDPPRQPERWDRGKFERYSRRSPDRHESVRFQERDHYVNHGERVHRDVELDGRFDRRGSRTRITERDRHVGDDRYARRRPEFLDGPSPSEVANRALAPYRRKSVVEHDIDIHTSRPSRPQYIRRQSSLDTFDRRPLPRYGDREQDEWRPPTHVPIPLPILDRRRSPSRTRRYREDDYEEIRHRDIDPHWPEEDYRDVRIHRERSTRRRSRSRRRSRARSSKSSTSSFEEISPVREPGRKGRTRMPKRLVHKQAVIDLGYPFEEEEDFVVVKRALEKEQIDEIIKVSETYKESKITYIYEETKEIEAPPSLPPPPLAYPAEPPVVMVPVEPVREAPRPASPTRTLFEERIEESNHISGPLAVLVPEKRSEREIRAEIRALEAERRLIKLERESDYEVVEKREPRREVIRVEKDRKVRRRVPEPGILGAMVATLT